MYLKSAVAVLILLINFSGFANESVELVPIEDNINSTEEIESVISEAEEQEKIDQEISQEVGSSGEIEEAKRLDPENKLILNGIAMPDSDQKKGKVYYLEGANELQLENIYFDIPVVYNKRVQKWINYYTGKGRKYFELHIARAGRYAPLIGSILEERGLPRDLIFLAMAESGFNNNARSIAAAVGPWQFMPATGKMYSLKQNWFVDERRDPLKATMAAATYLSKLYSDFGSWKMAMAAYNAGEGKIGRAIKRYKTKDFWDIVKGSYLKSETKNYVPKIMALAIIGKNLKTFGFNQIDFRSPLSFDEIEVKAGTDLIKLAKELDLDIEEIRKLNPELLRWFVPLDTSTYTLKVPLNKAEQFKKCCINKELIARDFQTFRINKSKMSVSAIAKKFRIRSDVLALLNNVKTNKTFNKGEVILLPFRTDHKVIKANQFYADMFYKKRVKSIAKKVHVVRKGESLHSVAKRYRISLNRLLALNSIKKSNKIGVGKRLVIR